MRVKRSFFLACILAICPLEASSAAQVSIVNGTHFAVLAVKSRPHGVSAWQGDLLNQNTLGIGQLRKASLPAGGSCSMDFLAILSDGHKLLMQGRNVCKGGVLAVTDDRK